MYIIDSFESVIPHIKKGTLIICDIDDTLLRYEKDRNYFIDKVGKIIQNKVKAKKYANEMYEIYKDNNIPFLKHGFMNLLKKIEGRNELVFLTARKKKHEMVTRNEFKHIGLDYDSFKVFYTGERISKGDYIKKHFNVKNSIFIDDYLENIKDVSRFPSIKCFKII